jgi:membrane protein
VDLKMQMQRAKTWAEQAPILGPLIAIQRRFSRDLGGVFTSAITYHAFLSLFPMLLIAASVTGFILDDPETRQNILRELSATVPGLQSVIGDSLEALVRGRNATGIIGLVGLAWTGTGVVRAAGHAMTDIKEIERDQAFVSRIGWAFGSMFGLGMLAASGLTLTVLASVLPTAWPVRLALFLLGIAFDVLLFMVAYRLLTPGSGPAFDILWPGALLGGAGLMTLKIAGSWFARRTVSNAEDVYGPFAATVGVLIILSLAIRVFLYGAVINTMRAERKGLFEQAVTDGTKGGGVKPL